MSLSESVKVSTKNPGNLKKCFHCHCHEVAINTSIMEVIKIFEKIFYRQISAKISSCSLIFTVHHLQVGFGFRNCLKFISKQVFMFLCSCLKSRFIFHRYKCLSVVHLYIMLDEDSKFNVSGLKKLRKSYCPYFHYLSSDYMPNFKGSTYKFF